MKDLSKDQAEQVAGACKTKFPPVTTLAVGEEGVATTLALGEEGPIYTTLALGEEGDGGTATAATTSAFGSF